MLVYPVYQIAVVNLLKDMAITPTGLIGLSVGEIACAYTAGSLTTKQAMLAAYWLGYCRQEADLPPGGVASIGKAV